MSRWVYRGPPNFPFTLNRESNQARGLIAWWPTISSRGQTVLRDMAGTGLTGTFFGNPSWASVALMGPVVDFDGASDYINIVANNTALDFDGASAITISAWIRIRSYQASSPNIRGIMGRDDEGSALSQYFLRLGDAGDQDHIQFIVTNAPSGGENGLTTTSVVELGTLYLVVGTWDGTTQRLYLNGVEEASQAVSGTMPSRTTTFNIGTSKTTTSNRWFDGQIGDVRVYNRALSGSEVRALYAPQTRWELYLPAYRPMLVRKVSVPPAGILPFQSNMVGSMQMLTGGIHG